MVGVLKYGFVYGLHQLYHMKNIPQQPNVNLEISVSWLESNNGISGYELNKFYLDIKNVLLDLEKNNKRFQVFFKKYGDTIQSFKVVFPSQNEVEKNIYNYLFAQDFTLIHWKNLV